jgi:hypothetical protein
MELSRRRRFRLSTSSILGLALVAAGCRFSGSAEDPYAEEPLSAASGGGGGQNAGGSSDSGGTGDTGGTVDTGGASGTAGTSGAAGISGTAGTGGNTGGAPGTTGGHTGSDSGVGGGTGGRGTGGTEAGVPPPACQPATPPAVCDPVKNFGCLVPFSFCDIDPAQAVATGRCVFPWTSTPPPPPPADAGGSCYVDATTDTCTPTSTCVNGSCRKLCYCDADCQGGQCCTEPASSASTTVRLCGPC